MIPRSLAAGQDVTITSGVTDRCSCPSWTMWCVHDWHTSPQDPRIPSPCVPFQASGCPSEVLGLVLPIKHPPCCLDHRGILMEPHGGRVPLQGEAHRQVPPTHCHISSSQRGPVSSHCPTPSRPAQPRPCGQGKPTTFAAATHSTPGPSSALAPSHWPLPAFRRSGDRPGPAGWCHDWAACWKHKALIFCSLIF